MKVNTLFISILILFISDTGMSQSIQELKDSIKVNYYKNPVKAIKLSHQILPLHKKEKDWIGYIWSLIDIADNYNVLQDFENADLFLDKSLLAAQKYEIPLISETYGYIWNLYGVLAYEKNDYVNAAKYFHQTLAIDTTIAKMPYSNIASSYSNIANIYNDEGDYQQAIYYNKQALSLTIKGQKIDKVKNKANLIRLYLSIGVNYDHLKKYDLANQFHQKANQLLTTLSKKHKKYPNLAKAVYNNIGIHYQDQGMLDQTFLFLQKKLEIPQLSPIDISDAYKNIGTTFFKQKRYNLALDTLNAALKIRKGLYPAKHYVLSRNYKAIGDVQAAQKNYTAALKSYQKAIQAVVIDFDHDDVKVNPRLNQVTNKIELVEALSAKAQVFSLQNKPTLALKTYLINIELMNLIRTSFESNSSKLFLIERGVSIYEQAIQTAILLKKNNLACELAEKSKAVLLLEATRGIKARFNLPNDVLKQEHDFKVDIAYYERKVWKEGQKGNNVKEEDIRKWKQIIFRLKEKYKGLQAELKQKHPQYYQLQYNDKIASIKDIQRNLLNSKTAMISYFMGEKKVYIFTITKKKVAVTVFDKNKNTDDWVNNMRVFLQKDQLITNAHGLYYKTAFQLYKIFLAPALKDISKSVESLIIIPSEQLNFIPFEALLTNQPTFSEARYEIKKIPYLIRDYRITYGYSATLLLEGQKRKKDTSLKTFGGFIPNFSGKNSTQRGCNEGILGNLAYGRENILQINKIMDGTLHFDEEATSSNFKQLAKDYKILHLCTHACAEMDSKDTRIYFSDEELLAFELNNVPLQAQLAVLSACETGVGELKKGEGVMSLARSFMAAGCPSVVTSLWSVDDKSTSEIMRHFYDNLKTGVSKDKALHLAKLDYLDEKSIKHSHPYYWSGFVHIGNTEALFQQNTFSYWHISLIALVITIIGFYFWQKKRKQE